MIARFWRSSARRRAAGPSRAEKDRREKFGASVLAKERALAVSILAFAERPDDRSWLAALVENDPSNWVRDHAAWALQVNDRGSIARQLWTETVREIQRPDADLLLIATRLVRMEASLPATAVFWNRPRAPHPQINALSVAFWYSWQNRGGAKGNTELCGRKLVEYCRGQLLRDVAKRLAPWWNPTRAGS